VDTQDKPIVLVTGAAGDVGSALIEALAPDYRVVGLDREGLQASIPSIAVDLGSQDSVRARRARLAALRSAQPLRWLQPPHRMKRAHRVARTTATRQLPWLEAIHRSDPDVHPGNHDLAERGFPDGLS
jgi:nucleoside-diphosphate-sugar epimerase